MTTIYKEIPGFPGYRVGDDGSVWTCRTRFYPKGFGRGVRYQIGDTWIEMKRTKLPRGYFQVQLWKDGKSHHKLVHRLVLEAFVGPCPEGMECRHFPDDNKSNCRLENLSWATKKTNQNDRVYHGTHCRGEKHGIASMAHVKQETARDCGVAALMMITGDSREQVLAYFQGHDFTKSGAYLRGLDDYLVDRGYAIARKLRYIGYFRGESGAPEREPWPPDPFADVHLCEVEVSENSPVHHFVVLLRNGTCLDPLTNDPRRLSDYHRVLNVAAIIKR